MGSRGGSDPVGACALAVPEVDRPAAAVIRAARAPQRRLAFFVGAATRLFGRIRPHPQVAADNASVNLAINRHSTSNIPLSTGCCQELVSALVTGLVTNGAERHRRDARNAAVYDGFL